MGIIQSEINEGHFLKKKGGGFFKTLLEDVIETGLDLVIFHDFIS